MTGSGKRAALISVYDKAGILPLARSLAAADYVLLSTGGSEQYLRDNGIEVLSVSEYTGQREVMDGRVKTLHPKIHGGILARRDVMEDRIEIEREGIFLIDFVIVNLYPFLDHYHGGERDLQKLRSLIDIGGPTMLRAAAKNYPSVLPLIDEKDYQRVTIVTQSFPPSFDVNVQLKFFLLQLN
jgi:phosphoribosylaminoimidazolecarboxamide formyltransferase/IMP cyclohydrolase